MRTEPHIAPRMHSLVERLITMRMLLLVAATLGLTSAWTGVHAQSTSTRATQADTAKQNAPLVPAPQPARYDDPFVSKFQGGVRVAYARNLHHTDANIFVGCPECGEFGDGSGSGYALELFGEVPFNSLRALDLTFGVGIAERGGAFGVAATGGLPVLDPQTDQYVTLTRQHDYSASLKYLTLEGGVRFTPAKRWPAYLGFAIDAGLPLGHSTTYTQKEAILAPDGVLYPENSQRQRIVGTGEIPNLYTSVGLTGRLGYELPVSYYLTASPEITYRYPLTNVEPLFHWKVTSLTAGVAMRWHMYPKLEEPAPPQPAIAERQDPRQSMPKLSAVSAASEPLHIIETTVTETFPILPYVFFDSASPVLPERFAQLSRDEVARFRESELPHRSLESYYNLLNVIGKRLTDAPAAMLTINGTTDRQEVVGKEMSNNLALARATRVKQYLTDVWGVAPERLTVTTSEVPNNPSSTQFAQGYEENRRVELSSNDDQILKPIVHERFREESSLPKSLPFRLDAASTFGLRDWKLAVSTAPAGESGTVVFERFGKGAPPASLDWRPNEGEIELLARSLGPQDSLRCEFTATSTNGATATRTFFVPARKTINPYELSRLSLIVFDFDQAAINEQNRRMITQFVAKSIYPASTASITGSTDNLGELQHNQKLSEDRAFNVRDLILKSKADAKITSTRGIGPSQLLYDNNLPEGRYYCRTVKVEVETPLDAMIHQE